MKNYKSPPTRTLTVGPWHTTRRKKKLTYLSVKVQIRDHPTESSGHGRKLRDRSNQKTIHGAMCGRQFSGVQRLKETGTGRVDPK